MCAEGVGSGVIRATRVWTEAIPSNHCIGVGNVDSHEIRRALFISLAVNQENRLPGKVLENIFDILNLHCMDPA